MNKYRSAIFTPTMIIQLRLMLDIRDRQEKVLLENLTTQKFSPEEVPIANCLLPLISSKDKFYWIEVM